MSFTLAKETAAAPNPRTPAIIAIMKKAKAHISITHPQLRREQFGRQIMIYTCFEMLGDCRADKPEGWRYLISNYVPVIRKLAAHYAPNDAAAVLEWLLTSIRKPKSDIFESLDSTPERWFLAEVRQKIISGLKPAGPAIEIDLATVAEALEPLTVTEKQCAWIETMRYSHAETGSMLRMAPATVEKMREKAAGLIRGKVDSWNRGLLQDNGVPLGVAAATPPGADCLDARTFLDLLDGRTTWRGREQMEHHVSRCWRCIDHLCRMAEVVYVVRDVKPLTEAEAAPFEKMLSVPPARKPLWKKLLR
jgi:hypothetical protein